MLYMIMGLFLNVNLKLLWECVIGYHLADAVHYSCLVCNQCYVRAVWLCGNIVHNC